MNTSPKNAHTLYWNNGYTHFNEAVSLLQKLISIPSFEGYESRAADLMVLNLLRLDIPVHRKMNNIWAFNKYYDSSRPTYLLNAHIDTAFPSQGYSRDPFCPEISHGKVYGLGSNSGGCMVSMLAAFLHYYHQQHLPFNLCFAATADAVAQGSTGICSVLSELKKPDFAIIGESSRLQMAANTRGHVIIDCFPQEAYTAEDDRNQHDQFADALNWFKEYRFTSPAADMALVEMNVTANVDGHVRSSQSGPCFAVDIYHAQSCSADKIVCDIRRNVSCKFIVRPFSSPAGALPQNHPLVEKGKMMGCNNIASPALPDRFIPCCPSMRVGPGDPARYWMADEFIFLEEIKKGITFYIRLLGYSPVQFN